MISVVMPVRNAALVVERQLGALARQTYQDSWELIVADNGSDDGGATVLERWRDRIPGLRVIDASDRHGAAAARNQGAELARGHAIAFCDADDVVAAGWLAALAKALETYDFIAGACEHDELNPGTADWHARSFETAAPVAMGFKPYASSANMAISRTALLEVGGFDEGFARFGAAGEDIDLSWRLQLGGHDLHFEPSALVFYRHRHDLGGVWRQNLHYGMADVLLYQRYRVHGLCPRSLSQTFRGFGSLLLRTPALTRRGPRGVWLRDAAHRCGRVRGSLRERVMFL